MHKRSVTSCPFCGGGGLTRLYDGMVDRLGLYGRRFDVLSCPGCGSALLAELPKPGETAGLYPEEYIIKEDKGGSNPLLSLWANAEMELFYKPVYRRDVRQVLGLAGLKRGRVLDVGCGNGGRMAVLSEAGFEVEGLETSAVDVEYVNRRHGLKARLGSLMSLEIEPESYDAITFFNVFEHLPDPAETAEKVRGLLKPGGFVAISGPVMDGAQAGLFGRRWIEVAEMPRHITVPSTLGIRRLLEGLGFTEFREAPAGSGKLAHSLAESLAPFAIGAAAYRKKALHAVLDRALGAAVFLMALPPAFLERLSGRASIKLLMARKPGGLK